MSPRRQPSLFDDAPLPEAPEELKVLGKKLPDNVRLGTTTWTYDGWKGTVYHRDYRGPEPARRLEEYGRYPLFRVVGIDSAYYEPPTEETLAAYGRALPSGFPCVSKVWDRITVKRFTRDPRWGKEAGQVNPDFLNAQLFKDAVLLPYSRAFKDHAGCFVFEFQPMHGRDLPDPLKWADQLDGFLKELPKDFRYAVELRNAELVHPIHGEVLKRNGVAHVFNSWTAMPTIGQQLQLSWVFPAPFTVSRALLKPGRTFSEAVKQFQPYDRIREPAPEIRADLLKLIDEAIARRLEALIILGNRLEGNSPGTIRALTEAWEPR